MQKVYEAVEHLAKMFKCGGKNMFGDIMLAAIPPRTEDNNTTN